MWLVGAIVESIVAEPNEFPKKKSFFLQYHNICVILIPLLLELCKVYLKVGSLA